MKIRKNAIDLTGKKFGELTAINCFRKEGRQGLFWNCICNCGNKSVAQGSHLLAGTRKSCGCLTIKNVHVNAVKHKYNEYKKRSAKRNIPFHITLSEFKDLIQKNCFYCDIPPSQKIRSQKTQKVRILYNGLDRIDNDKPYTIENTKSCCKYCNFAKRDRSFEEFKDHIVRVYRWLIDS